MKNKIEKKSSSSRLERNFYLFNKSTINQPILLLSIDFFWKLYIFIKNVVFTLFTLIGSKELE